MTMTILFWLAGVHKDYIQSMNRFWLSYALGCDLAQGAVLKWYLHTSTSLRVSWVKSAFFDQKMAVFDSLTPLSLVHR